MIHVFAPFVRGLTSPLCPSIIFHYPPKEKKGIKDEIESYWDQPRRTKR